MKIGWFLRKLWWMESEVIRTEYIYNAVCANCTRRKRRWEGSFEIWLLIEVGVEECVHRKLLDGLSNQTSHVHPYTTYHIHSVRMNTFVAAEYTRSTLMGGHLISKFMVFRIVVNCEMWIMARVVWRIVLSLLALALAFTSDSSLPARGWMLNVAVLLSPCCSYCSCSSFRCCCACILIWFLRPAINCLDEFFNRNCWKWLRCA